MSSLPSKKPTADLFVGFPGREEGLRNIGRYAMYQPTFYRSSVWNHAKRLTWFIRRLTDKMGDTALFDATKAELIAFVHDDPEIIIGDIMAGNKSKMTPAQLKAIEDSERKAIEVLVARSPRDVGGYAYRDLLLAALDTNCLEAKVVKFFDKFDAFGEALHEIYAGNTRYTKRITNEYGEIPTATEYYISYLNNFPKKFPEAQSIWSAFPFLINLTPLQFDKIAESAGLHTKDSLGVTTGYRPYDFWRETICDFGEEEEVRNLYIAKEAL